MACLLMPTICAASDCRCPARSRAVASRPSFVRRPKTCASKVNAEVISSAMSAARPGASTPPGPAFSTRTATDPAFAAGSGFFCCVITGVVVENKLFRTHNRTDGDGEVPGLKQGEYKAPCVFWSGGHTDKIFHAFGIDGVDHAGLFEGASDIPNIVSPPTRAAAVGGVNGKHAFNVLHLWFIPGCLPLCLDYSGARGLLVCVG